MLVPRARGSSQWEQHGDRNDAGIGTSKEWCGQNGKRLRGGKDKGIGVREYLVLVPADAVELARDPAGTAVGVEQGRMPVLRAVEILVAQRGEIDRGLDDVGVAVGGGGAAAVGGA